MMEEYSSIIFCSYSEKKIWFLLLFSSEIQNQSSWIFLFYSGLHYICMLISLFNIIISYNVYIDKDIYKHIDAYFTIYLFKFFKNSIWRFIFCVLFNVKYALINIRSHYQYTYSIDLLSIRISIRILSIRMSKHRDQQAKGQRESALSCIKNYALCWKDSLSVVKS